MLWKEFLKLLMSDLLSELEFHVNNMLHEVQVWRETGKNCPFLLIFRLDGDVYDEDGNSLPSLDYDRDQIEARSAPSVADDVYTLYYPPEKRWLSYRLRKTPPHPNPFSLFSLSLAQRCRHPCWTSHRRTVPFYVHVCVCYVLINVLSRFCNFKHEGFILIIFFCFEALTKTKQKNQSALKRGKSHWLKSLKFNERIETMMNIFTFQEKGWGGKSATSLCVRMRWIYLPWRLKSLFFFK